MAVDVVTLQIRVDASQVEEATRRLSGMGTVATTVETKTRASAVGVTQLNNAFRTLAVQASGADPAVARLVSSIGGFAVGGAMMTAVLAGVTAIGLAWRRIGEDARYASQQADELIARLQRLNGSTQGRWDQIMASGMLAGARGDLAAIRGEGVMGGTRGLGLAATRAARENAALNRVLLLSRYSASAVEQGYEFTGPTLAQRGSLGGGGGGVGGGTSGRDVARSMAGLTPFGAFGFSGATAGVDIGGIADRMALEVQRRATSQAQPNSWAIGAGGFGGVLETVGPRIISSISSIVQGLAEQAERAALAQRAWKIALEDYALMFDELTPTESRLRANERAFRQAAEQLRGTYGHGLVLPTVGEAEWYLQNMASATDPYDKELRALYEAFLANADQARNLAQAERELYDARFRALNAPTGFNTSYYGWMAGFGGDSPQTSGKDKGDVEVHVYVDGEEVATKVERKAKQRAKRGGPSPYLDTAR